MYSKQTKILYNGGFKSNVKTYKKQHSNRAVKRHFGPSPATKLVCKWRKQEKELQKLKKNKLSFHTDNTKRYNPEA